MHAKRCKLHLAKALSAKAFAGIRRASNLLLSIVKTVDRGCSVHVEQAAQRSLNKSWKNFNLNSFAFNLSWRVLIQLENDDETFICTLRRSWCSCLVNETLDAFGIHKARWSIFPLRSSSSSYQERLSDLNETFTSNLSQKTWRWKRLKGSSEREVSNNM